MALLPTKIALKVNDFRLISLVGSNYKILAKVLANRGVLGEIVFDTPNALIQGKQTLGSIHIANECLDSCLKSESLGIVVPHCLMWCLWRERNSRYFEDNERSIPNLKLFFFRTILDWLVALRNQSFSSFLDFLDSCNFCTCLLTPEHSPVY